MKVSRQQAEQNKASVLRIASRALREKGEHGMRIHDVMVEAGLTHGAFYKQFQSKDDLVAQACALALAENLEDYKKHVARTSRPPVNAIADGVLNIPHRDSAGIGCLMAALGSDLSRAEPGIRREVTAGVKGILDWMGGLFSGKTKKQASDKAIAAYATMVGALMLSRAVDDRSLSERFLKAALAAVKEPLA